MNSQLRSIIADLEQTNPSLPRSQAEKLVARFAARRPAVKPSRRFRKELKERIFGRPPLLRRLLQPQRIVLAASVVAAAFFGILYFSDRTNSMEMPSGGWGIYSARSGTSLDSAVSENSRNEKNQDDGTYDQESAGDVDGLIAEGPPGIEGKTAPAFSDISGYTTEEENREGSRLRVNEKEKKLYFGYLKLTVKELDKTRDRIVAFAGKVGGYVETASARQVVIRVPRAAFNAAIAEISTYGELTDKSIETYDVSAAYEETRLRLSIATAARDRLYALLEKVTDVKERFRILKEIQRLTEQIELYGRKLRGLDRMVEFSRISVTLSARAATQAPASGGIPFPWIKEAAELRIPGKTLRGRVTLDLPLDFALLEKERCYYAENPFGVSLAVYSELNSPRGDGEFWRNAVAFHLHRQYADAVSLDLGKMKAVLFTSHDADPFYLLIGVTVSGNDITVCKAVFPNTAQYQAQKDAVENMIGRLEVSQ